MIRSGHQPEHVWHYTPREIFAHYELLRRDRADELRENLIIATLAMRGESSDIKQQLGEWD